jgi:hypothetical protein
LVFFISSKIISLFPSLSAFCTNDQRNKLQNPLTQPQLLEGLKYESQVKNNGKEGSQGALLNSQH